MIFLCFNVMSAVSSMIQEARVSEITRHNDPRVSEITKHTDPAKSASSLVHHRRKLLPLRSSASRVPGTDMFFFLKKILNVDLSTFVTIIDDFTAKLSIIIEKWSDNHK